ncbi:MAG: integrase core domain-containing protein [Chloroflexota bacterium]
MRDECLNQHWFQNLTDARLSLEAWRQDDNRQRPDSSLAYPAPEEYSRDALRRAGLGAQTMGSSLCLD